MAGYGKKKRNNPHGKNMKRTHDKSNPREPGRTGTKVSNPGETKTVRAKKGGRYKVHRRSKRRGG